MKALANNKMRAFLTMLGIIIGVAAVITMIALGQGTKQSIQKEISNMGSNIIMVHPGGERRGGVRMDPSEMQTLKIHNYEVLRDECMFLAGIILFSLTTLFQLVTLPVEFNASGRAVKVLENSGMLYPDEVSSVKKVLGAAALTYVASAAAMILQLLRLLILTGGRRRND